MFRHMNERLPYKQWYNIEPYCHSEIVELKLPSESAVYGYALRHCIMCHCLQLLSDRELSELVRDIYFTVLDKLCCEHFHSALDIGLSCEPLKELLPVTVYVVAFVVD